MKTTQFIRSFFVSIFIVLLFSVLTGCGATNTASKEVKKEKFDLSQQVAHTNYQFQVPGNWEVVYSEVGDPTVFFKDENQQDIGGLLLLRLENVKGLGERTEEIASLATNDYKVYKGVQNDDERFICFHIPNQNSGYQLFFKSNKVSEKEALSIAKTFKFKLLGG
jgi:hypothetical protein